MRQYILLFLIGASAAIVLACAPAAEPVEAGPEFRPTATIKDIMLGIIDPNADAIWNASAIVVDFEGIHESFPETDEEWDALRYSALTIIEASNMMLIPGRQVAAPGDQSEFPGIELEPEEIADLIAADPETYARLSLGLHDAATEMLAVIDARDPETLLNIGDNLDRACERCHLEYWYPGGDAARRAFEEAEALREQ